MSDRIYVTCPKCGHEWFPDPRLWRNKNNMLRNGKKELRCTRCNKFITLSMETTRELLLMYR